MPITLKRLVTVYDAKFKDAMCSNIRGWRSKVKVGNKLGRKVKVDI